MDSYPEEQDEGLSSTLTPRTTLQEGGKTFTYEVVLMTRQWNNYQQLADALAATPKIPEFKISPASQ